MKTLEKELARELRRREGLSLKVIAVRLGVSVSSVSRWVRDIELTDEQRASLVLDAYNGHVKGRAIATVMHRDARLMAQEEGRMLASRGDVLHAAGCMLYWAEGSKRRNQLVFSNSDPEMIRFFVGFLRAYFSLDEQCMRITCNLFADHVDRQRQIEDFWLETCGVPRSCLCKSTVNVHSKYSKKRRTNRLPYGTCRVVVSRTSITQSIFGAIQEYAGFDRPEWLDARS